MNIDLKVRCLGSPYSLSRRRVQMPAVLGIEGYVAKMIYEEAQKIAAEISFVAP